MEMPNYIIDKAFRPDNRAQTLFSGSFALILEEPISGRTCQRSRLWGGSSRSGATDVARPGGWVRRARGGAGGWGGVTFVRLAVLMGLWKQVGMFWARSFMDDNHGWTPIDRNGGGKGETRISLICTKPGPSPWPSPRSSLAGRGNCTRGPHTQGGSFLA